jgi:hypothetical protein
MWSEMVELDARGLAEETAPVLVSASFRMRNTGTTPERLQVRFPLEHPLGIGDAYGGFPTVQDLVVNVDSQRVVTGEARQPTYSTYWGEASPEINWATFDVAFPVGRDVIIDVSYAIQPTPSDYGVRLDYVMETGAGWWGPIVRAEIIVRLPYMSSTIRANFHQADTWPAPHFSGDSLRWVRWTMEPTSDDNFHFLLAPPHLWMQILTLSRRVRGGVATPDDYLALAEAYWDAGTEDKHGWVFFPELAIAAQGAARLGLARFPDTADLMAQEGLMRIMWIATHSGRWTLPDPPPAEQALLNSARCEIARALGLDPSSTRAQEAAEAFQIGGTGQECSLSGYP